ncbi:hypothetical protein JCM5350_003949 [Sporobolomyces pararoseus]
MASRREPLPKWSLPDEFWTPEERLRRGGPIRQSGSPQPLTHSPRGNFAAPHNIGRATSPSSRTPSFSQVRVPHIGDFQLLREQLQALASYVRHRPSTAQSLDSMCLFLNEIKRPVWDQLEREGALGSASDICAILTTMLEDYRKDFRHLYRVRIDFEKARILLLLNEQVDALYLHKSPMTLEDFKHFLVEIDSRLSKVVGDLNRLNQTLNHLRAINSELWRTLSETRASWDSSVFNRETITQAILIEFDQTIGTIFVEAQSASSTSRFVARPRTPPSSRTPPRILLRTPTAEGRTEEEIV